MSLIGSSTILRSPARRCDELRTCHLVGFDIAACGSLVVERCLFPQRPIAHFCVQSTFNLAFLACRTAPSPVELSAERSSTVRIPSPRCSVRSQPSWLSPCPCAPAACNKSHDTAVTDTQSLLAIMPTYSLALVHSLPVMSRRLRETVTQPINESLQRLFGPTQKRALIVSESAIVTLGSVVGAHESCPVRNT